MWMFWKTCGTPAAKRYQRRVTTSMCAYVLVTLCAALIVRRGHPVGWHLYFWSVLPAIPIMAVLYFMGRYLKEEKDEYKREQIVQSLLFATAVLLGTLTVNDFLRAFAGMGPLDPCMSFVVFCLTYGASQGMRQLRDRVPSDE
jgi:hypothetical protein